eukprot:CAMPEP_0197823826 /NCGR_PEP_ID=MMETSP1437-20131217/1141_1 /TAXON_ID=49252 ORGANISM="Eucampia antarctica, Strain CCMP1452" /NCGR_SAMPLE_ID=MMETSP1437 /ASSEMBLY_ACC=CAM_ASM_001096 /LENGTH=202 /DNA_ID=CAMNT_0043423183 /DNA_START=91 /DNA_END=699 /DNA_ORIENTATION=+
MIRKALFFLLVILWSPFAESRLPNVAFASTTRKIQAGDKIPSTDLHWGFNPPQFINVPMHVQSRNVIVVGVKGAYVPQSEKIVRSYIEHSDALKQDYDIDEVVVYAINDGGVMGTWQKAVLQTDGTLVTCFADPSGDFTDQCGMPLIHEEELGLVGRCPNFFLHVDNCVVQHVQECTDNDNIESICALAILEILKKQKSTVK